MKHPRSASRLRRSLKLVGVSLGAVAGLLAAARLAPRAISQQLQPPIEEHMIHHEAKNPDGSWKYTNALVSSSSPYLLQHAHNPVDWREWGADAIEEARLLDKPIFLSVGYSTCYWCHVMERQVFEDPEIAAQMNELFVCIKVDREQRPDVDEIYMMATRLVTQGGGWPNSVFLTTDLKPFFAGTYFGPTDQHGRPGFPRILDALSGAWKNRRPDLEDAADRLTSAMKENLGGNFDQYIPIALDHALSDRAVAAIRQGYDPNQGGFGQAPKFPQGFYFPYLLDVYTRTQDDALLNIITNSLHHMAQGGIYDHVAGGFHRYSTDGLWRIPHFEKMLYNQAQLAIAYADAYTQSEDLLFRNTAEGVLDFVLTTMTGDSGQFLSALDAETDAKEGQTYLWTAAELRSILDDAEQKLFFHFYALADVPLIPGHAHPVGQALYMKDSPRALYKTLPMRELVSFEETLKKLQAIHADLRAVRDQRDQPRLDDKVITAWSGLMIDAFAHVGVALNRPDYVSAAKRAADFALTELKTEDARLYRVWRDGKPEISATQEDYSFLIRGLISLHRATNEDRWLTEALALNDTMNTLFWDEQAGAYFLSEPDPYLIARTKSPSDGAIPSGNSVAAHNLISLYEITSDETHLTRAKQLLAAFSGMLDEQPGRLEHMAHAIERYATLLANQPEADHAALFDPIRQTATALNDADEIAQPATVTVSASSSKDAVAPGESFEVTLTLDIREGWHIYANGVQSESLIPTSVAVRSETPLAVERMIYPEPTTLEGALYPTPVAVYEGTTQIRAIVHFDQSTTPGSATINVLHRHQACDDRACQPPVEEVTSLQINIAE